MSFSRKQPIMSISEGLNQLEDYGYVEYHLSSEMNDHDCLFCVCPGLEALLPLSADAYSDYLDGCYDYNQLVKLVYAKA